MVFQEFSYQCCLPVQKNDLRQMSYEIINRIQISHIVILASIPYLWYNTHRLTEILSALERLQNSVLRNRWKINW